MARPARGRRTLGYQIALVTTAVAAVAVLLTGVVSFGLVRQAAATEQRRALARIADVATSSLRGTHGLTFGFVPGQTRRHPKTLGHHGPRALLTQGTGIAVTRVLPSGALRLGRARLLPAALGHAVATGHSVNETLRLAGRAFLVVGRPFSGGGGLVLTQPMSRITALGSSLLARVGLALLAGLVGAAVVGVVLARRLARPLAEAAGAAHRLAAGERAVRLNPAGPAEVAEVAAGLNSLTAALTHSEDRQRQFLLSVSHELRTPLTGIRGFAEGIADGVVADPVQAARVILAEADRLERLVRDLLDLARLGAEDFRLDLLDVDLAEIARSAALVWQVQADAAGVDLQVQAPLPVLARTDAGRVRQLYDLLVDNALRVLPAGAPLVVAARGDSGAAVLEVRDGGPGLSAEDRAVAFDRFALRDRYRGQRRVGAGLGLALVGELTARLGGTVEAGPAPEGGARFTVHLPRAGAPPGGDDAGRR